MFNTLSISRKGMSMIEVCIALLVLGVGIMALITLQPSAWRLSGKSDYLGRASGILAAQLQTLEATIANPNNTIPDSDNPASPPSVYVSGQTSTDGQALTMQHGDVNFSVTKSITSIASGMYRVNVRVTWPGNAAGIKESMIVTRQQSFSQ
jgi:prepilin-type N-terminal cleavage/methylation domain-containing protein